MAVAVKKGSDAGSSFLQGSLLTSSLVGMLYVLLGLFVVFFALPYFFWDKWDLDSSSFVNVLFLISTMACTGVALCFLGKVMAGTAQPTGLRAGVFINIFWLFLMILSCQVIGVTLENWTGGSTFGLIVGLALMGVVAFFMIRAVFRPAYEQRLIRLEEQGLFSFTSYKASQGQKVRRGTIMGILAVAGCGIYTVMIRNPMLGSWELDVPFAADFVLVLLPYQKYTLPLLLTVVSVWFGWRIVNYPPFADFLIATEAEINKVSWTTRKRLVQDTIVVLATVFLMTLFLLVVDVLWFKILSHPWIKVLRIDTSAQQTDSATEKPEY